MPAKGKRIDKECGYLDALVNNAGIVAPQMKVSEMSAERITKVLSTNVFGAFIDVAHAFLFGVMPNTICILMRR